MQRLTFVFILGLLLCSCSSTKMAEWHCKNCPVKDSTVITYVQKDSIVPRDSMVLIPRDSFIITFKDSVPCKDFEVHGEDEKGNKAKVVVKNHRASVQCECTEYKAKIYWLEHHVTRMVTKDHTLTRMVTITKPKTGFQKFKDWWFWICVAVLATLITRWVLKKLGKWPIPI